MRRFRREIKGSIALFLSMIMLLLVLLEGFLIDGSRVVAGKMMMSTAGDMALNAGLTYYDDSLRKIYGLFAVSETEEELKKNLEVYFKETIGEASGINGGDGGDGTQYTQKLLDSIKAAVTGDMNGQDATKIINLALKPGTFEVKGVPESALSNSYAIKNQILEYMKYRGPASLGYGMLEKLFAFKDLGKQQNAMEKKLDYEENLSDIQKACEEAYDNLVVYNRLLDEELNPSAVEEASLIINRNMYEAIIAVWCYSVLKNTPVLEEWETKPDDDLTFADMNEAGDTMEEVTGPDGSSVGTMESVYRDYTTSRGEGFAGHPRAAMDVVKLVLGYEEECGMYRVFYNTWETYKDEYDSLPEEEQDPEEYSEYEAIYDLYAGRIEKYISAPDEMLELLKSDIDNRMKTAADKLNQIAGQAENLKEAARLGKEALNDILTSMDTLEGKKAAWQGAIDDLSSGGTQTSMQTSMQADLDNKAKELNRQQVIDLQDKVGNGMAYAEMLLGAAADTKAAGFKLEDQDKSSYAAYMWNSFLHTSYKNDTNPFSIGDRFSTFDVDTWTENAVQTGSLSDSACTVYFVNLNGGVYEGNFRKMDLKNYSDQMDTAISGKNDPFYAYLERTCPKRDAEDTSKKDAEDKKKSLLEQGGSPDLTADGLPTLPSSGSASEHTDIKTTGGNAEKEEISKNAKENTKKTSNFLDQIGSLLEKGRDKLYISEYATKMFSYYTIDKTKEGEDRTEDEVTLSNYPMNAANNAMYKAEVEYILWGDASGSNDVSYTLATIFGIRLLLNMLYAFTGDPEIRSVSLGIATAIAGWTGFGVPLVQSVIIIAFALAESAYDIAELRNGKSIPIYKSTNTWVVKPSNMLGEITSDMITQVVKDAAKNAKELMFDKLDELTEETKDSFKSTFQNYADKTVKNIVSTASQTVLTPVQERLVSLINIPSDVGNSVEAQFTAAISSLRDDIAAEQDSIMKEIKLQAVDYFQNYLLTDVTACVSDIQQQEGLTTEAITEKVNTLMDECKAKLEEQLTSAAQSLVDSASGSVNNALDSANDKLQEKASEEIDKFVMRVGGEISSVDLSEGGILEGSGLDGGVSRSSFADALSMNYKEYLWMFIAVQSMVNEDAILQRIGTLIEANLTQSEAKPSKDFKLSEAYTFLEVKADADVSTTFFSLPVPVQGGGNVVLGQDKYTIGYHGVLGY